MFIERGIMESLEERKICDMIIKIDKDNCISTGNCIKAAPEIFVFDDQRLSSFREELIDIEQQRLIDACSVCPVDAIFAIAEDGKQIVP